MFDTMTITKVVGALCGSLLVFLMAAWLSSSIFTLGPAGHGEDHAQAYLIDTGETDEGEATVDSDMDVAAVLASGDAAAGEKVFAKCKACHKLDGSDGTGPHLNGVVGRPIAASEGFAYSAVLTEKSSESWTPEHLFEFLTNPKGWAPGTKMSFAGLPKPEDRANVIAYLASQP